MRGGITRYHPDPQSGSGFLKSILKGAVTVTKDLHKGGLHLVKRNIKRGVKRKALNYIHSQTKKKLDNIFGK